jgi:hypothetical protein
MVLRGGISVTSNPPDGGFSRPRLGVLAFLSLRSRKLAHASAFRTRTQAKKFACSLSTNKKPPFGGNFIGAEGRVRTADPSLFRRMLYQLSYLSYIFIFYSGKTSQTSLALYLRFEKALYYKPLSNY